MCQEECLSAACENDRGDCESLTCSVGCYPYMQGDGKCQESCKVMACEWDLKDCDCSPGCSPPLLANTQCDWACNVEACNFDNGLCVVPRDCAEGCVQAMGLVRKCATRQSVSGTDWTAAARLPAATLK